jgi:peptidoglycan/xylan/chitin deacetylase (PgdA/CDA1 family)
MTSLIKNLAIRSGVLRWTSRLRPTGIAILMYHSVLERPDCEVNTLGGIMHSSQVFRGQMEVISRHFSPVSLDDALQFLRGDKVLKGRPVVITFDDGYSDNLDVAIPILNQVGVPATFYVAVASVDTRKLPWPSRLRFSMHTTRKPSWRASDGTVYTLGTFQERDRAFLRASDECCQLAGDTQEAYVTKLERELDAAVPEAKGDLMMTWDQVRSTLRSGHIVGSHTMTHPNMAYIGEADAERELQLSKQRLEAELKQPVPHFSYPCPAMSPHWTQRTVEQTRSCGYKTAVTTIPGIVHRTDDPLSLRRVRPSKTVSGLRWNLEVAFAGLSQ